MKALPPAVLLCVVILSGANALFSSFEGFTYFTDWREKGEAFWKGRPSVSAGLADPFVPSQLPGPADLWAGAEKKQITIEAPYHRDSLLIIQLLESHELTPPLVQIKAGGREVARFRVEAGGGAEDRFWRRLGKASRYEVMIPARLLGDDDAAITIRTLEWSWMAIDFIKIYPPPRPWELWRLIPRPWAPRLFWAGLALLFLTVGWRWKRSERWRAAAKTAAFYMVALVGIPVVFLSAAEALFTVLNVADPDSAEDLYAGFKNPAPMIIDDTDDPSKLMVNPRRSPLPQSFDRVKAGNAYRIMFFGGSNVYKFQPTLRVIEERLRARYPGRKIEMLNFGVPAYGTHRIVRAMEEAAPYQPDLLILYSGHNEFLEKRFYAHILNEAEWLTRVRMFWGRFRFYVMMRNVIRGAIGATAGFHTEQEIREHEQGRVATQEGGVNVDRGRYNSRNVQRLVLSQYEANLRKIARIARSHNVRLAVITVASPLMKFPRAPCHDPLIGAEKTLEMRKLLNRVAQILNPRKPVFRSSVGSNKRDPSLRTLLREAVPILERARAIAPMDADVLFWTGYVKYYEKDYQGSIPILREAARHDCTPYRATPLTNAILRRVAKEFGLPLIDAQSRIERRSPFGISFIDYASKRDDWDSEEMIDGFDYHRPYDPDVKTGLFFDHCHLNYVGKMNVMELIAGEIIRHGWMEN